MDGKLLARWGGKVKRISTMLGKLARVAAAE